MFWTKLAQPNVGLLSVFNERIAQADERDASYLPNLRRGATLLAASDYSGSHHGSTADSYSFVITSDRHWAAWQRHRIQVRRQYALSDRRISYAKLNDRRKRAAIPGFIGACNRMTGLAVTLLVDKRIESLFETKGPVNMKDDVLQPFQGWRPAAVERMLRVTHLLAIFVAGISRPGQNIIWVTDEDEIAANDERLAALTTAFRGILDTVLPHQIDRLGCITTAHDVGMRALEDFAAIPDLIGGALTEVMSAYSELGALPSSPLILPAPETLKPKASQLMDLLFNKRTPLRKLVFAVEPKPGTNRLLLTNVSFSP